jgi:branched-chain amino acid transport system ATP-binding protein
MSLLQASKATKRFGGLVAVNEVDFVLEQGSIVSIIGPNGAGKTTFFNMLTGLYRADEGSIVFDGHNLVGRGPEEIVRLGICRTFQTIRLFKNLNALENILVGMHTHLQSSPLRIMLNTRSVVKEEQQAIDRARDLLYYVGLKGKANILAQNLPYGDQRRLEVARALASRPKLLLLDEPTAGMNPQETGVMTRFFRQIRDDLQITILLIEHDMKVVMSISEQIMVLDYGAKIAEGTPEAIRKNPRVIEAYLGRSAG